MIVSTPALLTAISALIAVPYGVFLSWRSDSWVRSILKTLPVIILSVAAAAAAAPATIVAGLALGALGDLCLSRPGDRAFLAGMAAFALGHLAYVGAFAMAGQGWPAVFPAVVLILLAISTEVWLRPKTGALAMPVRAYVVVIAAMGLTALRLPADHGILLAGVVLFVVSDLVLAIERFVLAGRAGAGWSLAVWFTYWAGQALIAAGAVALAV